MNVGRDTCHYRCRNRLDGKTIKMIMLLIKYFERIGTPLTEVPSDDIIDKPASEISHPQPGQEDSLAIEVPADEQPAGDSTVSDICDWENESIDGSDSELSGLEPEIYERG
jgi:hypothetical protein